MTTELTDVPAAELPELLDLIIWNMSGHHPLEAWRAELLARPDVESEDVQCAVAVIDEYFAPAGSPEAIAAKMRAWPDA
ncbi:MAG TPA: hypothetical protein VGC14_17865 [Rhizobium sp.]